MSENNLENFAKLCNLISKYPDLCMLITHQQFLIDAKHLKSVIIDNELSKEEVFHQCKQLLRVYAVDIKKISKNDLIDAIQIFINTNINSD